MRFRRRFFLFSSSEGTVTGMRGQHLIREEMLSSFPSKPSGKEGARFRSVMKKVGRRDTSVDELARMVSTLFDRETR